MAESAQNRTEEQPDFERQYAMPAKLISFVHNGVLHLSREDATQRILDFEIPSLGKKDGQGRTTTYSLVWIHPEFNDCEDLPNFFVSRNLTDQAEEILEIDTLVDLLDWLRRPRVRPPVSAAESSIPPDVTDAESAKAFVLWCIRRIGTGYHPDTPFDDYVDTNGNRCFSDAEANCLDALADAVFHYADPYEIGLPVTRQLLRSLMLRSSWNDGDRIE